MLQATEAKFRKQLKRIVELMIERDSDLNFMIIKLIRKWIGFYQCTNVTAVSCPSWKYQVKNVRARLF